MEKLRPGQRFTLELSPEHQADGWWLVLDGTPIDKYGGVVFEIDGLDFTEFRRTGQKLLWDHDTGQPPLGDVEFKVQDGKWLMKPHFASELNPLAATVEKLATTRSPVTGKFYLNAVSAGIDVIEVVEGKREEYVRITKSSPREVSVVVFGAHPRAGQELRLSLSEAEKEGVVTGEELEKLILAAPQEQEEDPPAEGEPGSNPAHDELSAEVATLRAELSEAKAAVLQMREEIDRLVASRAPAPNPETLTLAGLLETITTPEGSHPMDREEVRNLLAAVLKEHMAAEVSGAIRSAVRRQLGRLD